MVMGRPQPKQHPCSAFGCTMLSTAPAASRHSQQAGERTSRTSEHMEGTRAWQGCGGSSQQQLLPHTPRGHVEAPLLPPKRNSILQEPRAHPALG